PRRSSDLGREGVLRIDVEACRTGAVDRDFGAHDSLLDREDRLTCNPYTVARPGVVQEATPGPDDGRKGPQPHEPPPGSLVPALVGGRDRLRAHPSMHGLRGP